MLEKPLESITAADLESLVTSRIGEGRALDYKEELPGGADKDTREFLADVSSFANTSGGHIVYGVAEVRDSDGRGTGIPREVVGVQGNMDAQRLRLDSMQRDGIDPRIPSLRWHAVPVAADRNVLICWIQKSWQAPHMVTVGGLSRFYARGGSGKYQLDVQQLRAAFLGAEGLNAEIRRFRQERLTRIGSDETPLPLWAPGRIVLHVAPVEAFDQSRPVASPGVELSKVRTLALFGDAYTHRYNLDGVLAFEVARSNGLCTAYTQVFRNGVIEGVDTVMLRRDKNGRTDANWIPNVSFEEKIIEYTRHYLAELSSWGLTGPVLVMLSLIGVRGYVMGVDQLFREGGAPFDRDIIVVPEIWVDAPPVTPTQEEVAKLMRGALDVVWQAAGFPSSLNYTPEGDWKPRR